MPEWVSATRFETNVQFIGMHQVTYVYLETRVTRSSRRLLLSTKNGDFTETDYPEPIARSLSARNFSLAYV